MVHQDKKMSLDDLAKYTVNNNIEIFPDLKDIDIIYFRKNGDSAFYGIIRGTPSFENGKESFIVEQSGFHDLDPLYINSIIVLIEDTKGQYDHKDFKEFRDLCDQYGTQMSLDRPQYKY